MLHGRFKTRIGCSQKEGLRAWWLETGDNDPSRKNQIQKVDNPFEIDLGDRAVIFLPGTRWQLDVSEMGSEACVGAYTRHGNSELEFTLTHGRTTICDGAFTIQRLRNRKAGQ